MKFAISARFGGVVALGAMTAVTASVVLGTATPAWAKKSARTAVVGNVKTPYGRQGTRGTGPYDRAGFLRAVGPFGSSNFLLRP